MDAPNELPAKRLRSSRRGGAALTEFAVRLQVVTPILGGGPVRREVDEVEVIRAGSVRGHLRFWWRALYAPRCTTPPELYERESEIWGRAATDSGGRSAVEIRIEVQKAGAIDKSDIQLYDSSKGTATPGAYALWPARGESTPAPRRLPGTLFRLIVVAPANRETDARNALLAWILFGGYGSRTRRGLGSLRAVDAPQQWSPSKPTRAAIADLFGFDVFCSPEQPPCDVPWLAGASLYVGEQQRDAMKAWTIALDWLKEFRQGTSGAPGDRAREPGIGKPRPQRPSISNWPEADKVRHLKRKTEGHPPRHNQEPAWPRAGFGLPIIGQFQKNTRGGGGYDEPDGFELGWRSPRMDRPREFEEHDRLASPLILKALPLADGSFVPCALWLNRSYPENGEVGLARPRAGGRPNEKEVDPGTVAPFDRLVAPGDTPQFSALVGKQSLREAFLDWLRARYGTTVVAP